MKRIQASLRTLLFGLACALAIQAIHLVVQAAKLLDAVAQELLVTSRETQATLSHAQAVLVSVRGTAETVRKSAVQQMGYYEAAGRRSATALARLDVLLARTDDRSERITRAVETLSGRASESITEIGSAAVSARAELQEVAATAQHLMETSTEAADLLRERLADQRLDRMTNSLAESSQHIEAATASAAEAAGYVRDIVHPAGKSFWRRLLELFIPRPKSPAP
jgi:hypothetical protein